MSQAVEHLAAHYTQRLREEHDKAQAEITRLMDVCVERDFVIHGLNRTIEEQKQLLEAAAHALESYAHGNSSPDLAREIADKMRHDKTQSN